MDRPDARHYGYQIAVRLGAAPQTVYQILGRMLDDGWLTDGWEGDGGRKGPRRRYYELTDLGRRELAALASAVEP